MTDGLRTSHRRHVPVPGHKGIYMSESKGGRRYEVAFRDITGKRHFKVVGSNLQQALTEQAKIKVTLSKGVRAHHAPVTFKDVAEEWAAFRLHKLSIGTEKKYRSVLDGFLIEKFGKRKILSITTDEIATFLSELRTASGRKMSGSYAQSIYVVLYQVMKYAANSRRAYIPVNPCESLEQGERPEVTKPPARVFTAEEAQGLIAASPDWLKPIILTGMYSGLRSGEILGLRWEDIDFENNVIHVRWQIQNGQYVPTKGKSVRDVPLLPQLRAVLFSLPTRFTGKHLFTQTWGGRATYIAVRRGFQKAREDAGIQGGEKELTMHVCRHTFASALLRDGKDVVWVSELLGHRSPKVTLETYAHVIQRENRNEEAADRLRDAIGDLG